MRHFRPALLLAFSFFIANGVLASQSSQPSQAAVGALTNKDVLEMLKAGLGQEIVMAKIKSSNCAFDTSPDALKALKAANVPDAVILAMVQAPSKVSVATEKVLRTAYVTCVAATEIPIYAAPGDKNPVASPKCGAKISVLNEGDFDKVQTEDGTVGYIAPYFVSKPNVGQTGTVTNTSSIVSSQSRRLPASMLRAVAWRGVPWVTTSYYQQQGSANTNCTGSGTWIGNIWQGNSSCTTQYTPAQSVPINWQHYTIYNLVETSDSMMVLGCTRNWAFSKCAYLIPGNTFEFENKKGKISIKGHKAGKDKEQTLDLDIVSSQPKTSR